MKASTALAAGVSAEDPCSSGRGESRSAWAQCGTAVLHPGYALESSIAVFVFRAPQGQGLCALTPGTGAIHLRCGLQLSAVNEDVALMLVISSPAHNA